MKSFPRTPIFVAALFLTGLVVLPQSVPAASCSCRLVLEEHRGSAPDYRPLRISELSNSQRTAEFEMTVGFFTNCRNRCRDEFGVPAPVSSAANQVKKTIRDNALAHGKPFNWCGGWLSARLDSRRGNRKWKEGITGELIGAGGIRTCPSVPPGVADSCCCGGNIVNSQSPYPTLQWAVNRNGHLVRLWWDQGGFSEVVKNPHYDKPLVSGSLQRDPFGHGVVALDAQGNLVRAVEKGGKWKLEFVMPNILADLGGVRSCGLKTTFNPRFDGIWVVTREHVVRLYADGGSWTHEKVEIGEWHASQIVGSSLYESGHGQVAGVLANGQRWGIWFENGDPHEMRFAYVDPSDTAVPPSARCP